MTLNTRCEIWDCQSRRRALAIGPH